ncbi:MAG: hypothetical protein AAGF89_03040 [Bacteroidota bacterium]
MRIFFVTLCFLTISLSAYAQTGNPSQADSASLQQQFDEMLRVSNRYQQFKVVRQEFLNNFIANVNDSIQGYTSEIANLEGTISAQGKKIEEQTTAITEKEGTISSLNDEKDSISLLGMSITKGAYNTILWSVIIGLLALLFFALARMRLAVGAHREVNAHKEKLATELEKSKKERLKIEQELRRKLQDEINKRTSKS